MKVRVVTVVCSNSKLWMKVKVQVESFSFLNFSFL